MGKIITVFLLIALLLSLSIIGYGVTTYKDQALKEAEIKGYQNGGMDAVAYIIDQASQCPPTGIPLALGSKQAVLISVECLK